ncbi:MAG: hypothetical protein ACK5MK_06525 [Dysgonomonas sp.]
MKLLIFISVYFKNGFTPIECAASNEKIADIYARETYIRSNGKVNKISLSLGDVAKSIYSRYEDGKLKMYLILPIPESSFIVDELYIGYFTLSGDFKIEV